MKKNVYHKGSHQEQTQKKHIFQKHKDQIQKLSTPKNCQQTYSALTNQKNVAVCFKDVNTEETLSSQDQKLVETTNLWRQLFFGKKITTEQIRFCNDR